VLKLNGAGTAVNKGQCAYCVVRRVGVCHAYGEGEDLDLSRLEAAHLPIRVYEAGDIIYHQGERSDHIFNIISGWVDVHQEMADGRRQIGQFLSSGAVFGLKPRGVSFSHGATAITTTRICPIPIARVDDLRRHSPAFNEQFIWTLERENHLAVEALTIIGQGDSLERVARLLWSLASKLSNSAAVPAGVPLKVPITQRLIADATGLTAVHVNRVVRRLREQRVVDFHDGVMVVEDPGRLAALSAIYSGSATLWDDGAAVVQPQPGQVTEPDRRGFELKKGARSLER
jgi:CRP/FNR family transcriptional regulator, anaerobic regulatory protein